MGVIISEFLSLEIELVGQTLDEEHPKDEFLELGSVHLAPEDVHGLE